MVSQQEVSPGLKSLVKCHEFLIVDVVIYFFLGECFGMEADWLWFSTIISLEEYGSGGEVGGVNFELKGFIWVGIC